MSDKGELHRQLETVSDELIASIGALALSALGVDVGTARKMVEHFPERVRKFAESQAEEGK